MMISNGLSVLIVDDSRDLLELLRINLNDLGFNPFVSESVVEAIDILETTKIDLVITDLNMPKIGGLQLVKYISQNFEEVPILVITGYPNVQSAIDVMKLGALEYLIKPFTFEELEVSVKKIITLSAQTIEPVVESKQESFHGIIGVSDAMQKLYHTIERTQNNKATILIGGESGTGKEMVARAIHYSSTNSSAPFVAVNCGAIPEQLLESELFGHVKGSFTGAIGHKQGFFQAANGGTLFLDEIGNASLAVQSKLLRAIQEKEITMVGAVKSEKVDLRIISASNDNLKSMIAKGTFREDLFYRLNVINIEIPTLRDRRVDIPMLVEFFNVKYSKESQKVKLTISDRVMQVLMDYAWPGNVRELENFLHRVVVMEDKKLSIDAIPNYMKVVEVVEDDRLVPLAVMEKIYIEKVLDSVGGNKTKAAQILQIDRKTLREKIK